MMIMGWRLQTVAAMAVTVVVVVAMTARPINGQQPYVNNHQLDCENLTYDSVTQGFTCNGQHSSCTAYLTYRTQPPYTSPNTVGYLLGAQGSATRIASINNISSDVASIPTNTQLVVPVTCSCFNSTYYQHNASYTLKNHSETYFTVANLTYQGLTTCQAMISQNPYGIRNLSVGMDLTAPLRCACPTSNQSSLGFKYLLTYMVTWGDTFSSIAQTFGADEQAILDANQLQASNLIYPFTTILVPLATEPTKIQLAAAAAPPPTPPSTLVQDSGSNSPSSSNKTPVYVGVGVGAAAILIILFLLLFRYCRTSGTPKTADSGPKKNGNESSSAEDGAIQVSSNSWSLSSQGLKYAVESLTAYNFDDLLVATGNFGEEKRIEGTSVYRGNFKGDKAAVKVMKGDVSGEIDILKKINHSNIIRLSGFCLHEGNTYLVYEYADKGSLHDWLHGHHQIDQGQHLPWKQRVQIAYDIADGLNYLHNYTTPPYIHKNLKTSNILLDSNFRSKLSNFGLARTLQEPDSGNGTPMQLTRHVVGTQGYMAPEYIENGVITTKLDVFAFGVILLELLSGREAISVESDKSASKDDLLSASIIRVLEGDNVRQKLKNFMDSALEDEYPLDLAFSTAELAKSCVAHDLNARPSISQAFMTLSKILSSSLDWDPSSELHHSRSLSSAR